MALIGDDHILRCLQPAKSKELATWSLTHGKVRKVVFSPNAQQLATTGEDRTIQLWDVDTSQATQTLRGHIDAVYCLAYHPTDPLLVSGSADRTARIWNIRTGQETCPFLRGHHRTIAEVTWDSSGKRVVSVAVDGEIRVWDAETRREFAELRQQLNWADVFACARNGSVLASGRQGMITLLDWNAANQRSWTGLSGRIVGLAVSADASLVAAADESGQMRIWSSAGKLLDSRNEPPSKARPMVWATDGRSLWWANDDGWLHRWDFTGTDEDKP